jgi:hypothetical protein
MAAVNGQNPAPLVANQPPPAEKVAEKDAEEAPEDPELARRPDETSLQHVARVRAHTENVEAEAELAILRQRRQAALRKRKAAEEPAADDVKDEKGLAPAPVAPAGAGAAPAAAPAAGAAAAVSTAEAMTHLTGVDPRAPLSAGGLLHCKPANSFWFSSLSEPKPGYPASLSASLLAWRRDAVGWNQKLLVEKYLEVLPMVIEAGGLDIAPAPPSHRQLFGQVWRSRATLELASTTITASTAWADAQAECAKVVVKAAKAGSGPAKKKKPRGARGGGQSGGAGQAAHSSSAAAPASAAAAPLPTPRGGNFPSRGGGRGGGARS